MGKQGWRMGNVRCRVELATTRIFLGMLAGRAMRLERGIRVVVPRTAGLLQSTPTSIRFPHCYRSRINLVFSFGEAVVGRGVIDLTTGHFRPQLTWIRNNRASVRAPTLIILVKYCYTGVRNEIEKACSLGSWDFHLDFSCCAIRLLLRDWGGN